MRSLIPEYTNKDSMCTMCIQAKDKQKFIRFKVKRTLKPFELVHSDVCSPFSTPTFGGNEHFILFVDDYTRFTFVWMLRDQKSETCTTTYKSFQARVTTVAYQIRTFQCDNGQREYDNKTFRSVLTASGTTYEAFPPYSHHTKGVAERMIRTITEKAQAMTIDPHAPIQFWGEAFNTAVCLHHRSPNEGLKKRDDRNGYKAPYETSYETLHAFGKPTGNNISYKAPIHHLRQFGCYVSKLIPKAQRQSKFSPRSTPCMIVGHTHD